MASVDKATITVNKAASIVFVIVTVVGNFFATRYAVQLELQQQKNDLILAVEKLNNKDAMLEMMISQNKDQTDINSLTIESMANFIGEGLKPDRPKRKKYR